MVVMTRMILQDQDQDQEQGQEGGTILVYLDLLNPIAEGTQKVTTETILSSQKRDKVPVINRQK
jgi:hypothetical protein